MKGYHTAWSGILDISGLVVGDIKSERVSVAQKKDNLLSLTHILSSMSCGQNFKITIMLMYWSLWGNIFNLSNLGGRFLISKVTRGHRKFSDKIPRKPLGCKKLLYCLTSNCIFPVCCTTSPQSYRSPAAWI